MLALTLALSLHLGAAEARPEAWVVVSRRSGVAKPQALEMARNLSAALAERGVPTPTPAEDATSCNAKVPCLVELAQKKGVGVLIAVEAGSALDDVVVHVEALSVEEFGKKLSTFDFTGSSKEFQANLKEKLEEFFAPSVRNVLGLGTTVAKPEPVVEKKPDPVKPIEPAPTPVEKKPEPAPAPAAVATASSDSGTSPLKIVGIGAMAVGAVLLGVAVYFGVNTMGLENQRKALCMPGAQCTNPEAFDLYSRAGSSQTIGIGLAVAGGIVAAVGATLFVIDLGGGSSATVTPAASNDGMSLAFTGRF
ncbi:MAG: hypothetical protein JNK82_06100 [Myxococcaceae bacterium]|nr:hypothetical protein [Myxococcaceae bacterium]